MRVYTGRFDGEAETLQVDFWEIRAGAGKLNTLLSILISQLTEVGDAEEEMLLIRIVRSGSGATSGSGGTAAPTFRRVDPGDAAFGGTVDTVTNTTKISGGSPEILYSDNWNIRQGGLWLPPDTLEFKWADEQFLTIELATTPGDSTTFASTIFVGEEG